jgi:hypothetical protein
LPALAAALVWHLDAAGKVDRVVNLSGDQHQVDAFFWANFPLKPLPKRLVGRRWLWRVMHG